MDSLCLCVSGVVVEAGESMSFDEWKKEHGHPDNVRHSDGSIGPLGNSEAPVSVWEWLNIRVGWVMWHLMIVIVVSFGVGVLLGVQLG